MFFLQRAVSGTIDFDNNHLKQHPGGVFDALIISHEWAYNPHYASLRQHARRAFPKRNFQLELARKAPWIQTLVRAMATSKADLDETWINRGNELALRYPELKRSPLAYRTKELWMRYVGWRFAR